MLVDHRQKPRLHVTQQRYRNGEPLRLKLFACHGATRAPIPVSRIGEIALFTVEVGVDPRRALIGFIDLCTGMCAIPVALRIPPKGLQSRTELWWLWPLKRGVEGVQVHRMLVAGER